MKAYSYLRFSTPEQRKGDSLRRQLEASQRYAEANGLELDDTLSLQDLGVSAFRGHNRSEGALGEFLKAIETGRVAPGSVLLVESLDRLSREAVGVAFSQLQDILRRGVDVVTLQDQRRYSRETLDSSFTDLLIALSIMFRANEESRTKATRIKAAWNAKKATAGTKPMTALCPAWLKLKADRSEYDVIESKAETIRRIFDLYLCGLGKMAIATRLNAEGIPPIGGSAGWQHSYITKIIQNRAVIGAFQPKQTTLDNGKRRDVSDGPEIPNYYPAVIDRSVFFQAQQIRDGQTRKAGRRGADEIPNLFRGIAFCGCCGATFNYVSKGKRRDTSPTNTAYLLCSRARVKDQCDHSTGWPYRMVEQFILYGISDIEWNRVFPEIGQAARDQVGKLHAQLLAEEGERAEVKRLLDNTVYALSDVGPSPALSERLRKLEADHESREQNCKRLGAMLADAQRNADTLDQVRQEQAELLSRWKAEPTTIESRLRLHRSLLDTIRRVEFHPPGAEINDNGAFNVPFGHIRVEFRGADKIWTGVVERDRTSRVGRFLVVWAGFDGGELSNGNSLQYPDGWLDKLLEPDS